MSIPYDPRSTRAEEFINDEEVLASLAYGEENKNNAALIDQLLDKVMTFKGLTHREAAVLLANDDPEVTKRIFDAAIKVKEHIYGKRIVLLRRSTFPTTASTAAPTARITPRTSTSYARSSRWRKSSVK